MTKNAKAWKQWVSEASGQIGGSAWELGTKAGVNRETWRQWRNDETARWPTAAGILAIVRHHDLGDAALRKGLRISFALGDETAGLIIEAMSAGGDWDALAAKR